MTILITGIAGFIGYHTAHEMLKKGYNVIGVDNLNDYYDPQLKFDRLKNLGIINEHEKWVSTNKSLQFIFGDISKTNIYDQLKKLKIDTVIHLAAQAGVRYSIQNPIAYINSNIVGFQNILDFCIDMNIRNILYASSSSVYGKSNLQPFNESHKCSNPESFYAATKLSNELVAYSYFKTKGLNSIGLRFFTVYGPWGRPDMAPIIFALSAINSKTIQVFNDGKQHRDFTYIDDIVNGISLCFNLLNTTQFNDAILLNIGRGKPISLLDFINKLELNLGLIIKKELKPAQIGDVDITFADTTLISRLTGYAPKFDLDIGIKYFTDWFKVYYNKQKL